MAKAAGGTGFPPVIMVFSLFFARRRKVGVYNDNRQSASQPDQTCQSVQKRMSSSIDQSGSWDRVAAELRACKESQQRAYGDVDNSTLGRYLAGDLTPAETAALEQTLDELPELRKLTELVQDVLRDLEPVEGVPPEQVEAPAPVILPISAARPRRRYAGLRRYAALAAACLLFACLALLPATGPLSAPRREAEGLTPLSGTAMRTSSDGATGLTDWADAPDAPPATAEKLELAVATFYRHGDAAGAEKVLRRHYVLCKQRHGPDHETTRYAEQELAQVYQLALNAVAEEQAPLAKRDAHARDAAHKVREQIVCRPAARVADDVVPVLNEALKKAGSREKRVALIKALGRIGPAARPESVLLLCERLDKADDEERLAVLDALERMGPAAGAAVPALQRLAKGPCCEPSREGVRGGGDRSGKSPPERARQVLQRLTGCEARVGVFDGAGLYSLGRSMEATRALRKLAQECGLEVRIETHCEKKPAAPPAQMGRAWVRVIVTSGGGSVRVVAAPASRDLGLDARALEKELAGRCKDDRALDAVLAAVEKAKK
jgi:hypothetical protein